MSNKQITTANKNKQSVFNFYKTRILQKFETMLTGKVVLLLCMGNTAFIKYIKAVAKSVIIIDDFCIMDEIYGCKAFRFINNTEDLISLIKRIENQLGMKIDVTVLNPPYDGDLHIKILNAIAAVSKQTICIHPADKYQKNIILNKKLPVEITNCEIIPQNIFNDIFGITNWYDGCITYIDANNKTNDYQKFTSLVKNYSIIRKIIDKTTVLLKSKIKKHPSTLFPLRCYVGCHWDASHNYKGTSANYEQACSTNTVNHIGYISLNSEIERKNLFEFLFTKFIKYCIKVAYGNMIVPYMNDYSISWDNKKLCSYFGITGYISDTEAEPNSEWEMILKEMNE